MASVDDLWIVDFGEPFPGEPAHHRPGLVLGPAEVFGRDLTFIILCLLSTTDRGLSLHVELEPSETNGLDHTSYVQCELLRSVSRRRLRHRIGRIDPVSSRTVSDILRALLDH